MGKKKRTVVIGSGLSGLCAAYFCHHAGHEVTVFESQHERGMDAHRLLFSGDRVAHQIEAHTLPHADSYLDVPLRVMSEDGWKTLLALCRHLQVETFAVDVPVTLGWIHGKTWFRSGSVKIGPMSLPLLGSLRYINRQSIRIGQGLLRFYKEPLEADTLEQSLDEFFRVRDYDPVFWRGFLLPLLSTITTCKQELLLQYPAHALLGIVRKIIFGPPLRRLMGGTKILVDRLSANIQFYSGSPVVQVLMPKGFKTSSDLRSSHEAENTKRKTDPLTIVNARGEQADADYVIFATQANHLKFIEQQCPQELDLLKKFKFDRGELVVHRDDAVMPPSRKDWTPLSYQLPLDYSSSMFSVWVNPIEPSLRRHAPVFQTWNPQIELRKDKILSRIPLERAVVDLQTQDYIHKLSNLIFHPTSRIFFCGSWAYPGVPLLESAVKSAAKIAHHLGIQLPISVNG